MNRAPWIPKLREVEEQCASCPFREGNDVEFARVVLRLRRLAKIPEVPEGMLSKLAFYARHNIRAELIHNLSGEFHCHCTVYDAEGEVRPSSEHRQCKGATEFYRQL